MAATRHKRHATSTTFTELTLQTNAPPVYWFARFRSGNFDLKNEPRGRPKTLVDNDELKAIVEADDTQSTAELAAAFDVSVQNNIGPFASNWQGKKA